jgi:mannose-6-phosphate isomerase-like protein (cupin superfamily)
MSKITNKEPTGSSNDGHRQAPAVKFQPRSQRSYFDVGIGSICLSGADTWGKYCLLELGLAPGMSTPRHTHTREDEAYFVVSGELEVIVGEEIFLLRAGDTLIAPRNLPHQLRNPGKTENHYLVIFSPSGLEEFVKTTCLLAPSDASAPTAPPPAAVQNVFDLAVNYGIDFEDQKF